MAAALNGDASLGQTEVLGIPAAIFPPEVFQELNVQETPSAESDVKGGAQTEYEAAGTKMQALWPNFGHNARKCSRERLAIAFFYNPPRRTESAATANCIDNSKNAAD